jgi:SEC-C motif domain protein
MTKKALQRALSPTLSRRTGEGVITCPCGSGADYENCCGHYLNGAIAPTAEKLMRSRYTAYTLENETYLQKTWHATTRPTHIEQQSCKWIGLTVLAHQQEARTATVEFIAKYKVNGRAEKMHEVSRFVFEDGQWFYLDGQIN